MKLDEIGQSRTTRVGLKKDMGFLLLSGVAGKPVLKLPLQFATDIP